MLTKAGKRVLGSKSIFKDLFRGKRLGTVPFLPYAFELAARMEQVALEELSGDPGLMVNALINAQKIIGGDAILTRIDMSLPESKKDRGVLADDFFLAGKPAVSLEATRRLKEIAGRQAVLACQITGPLTLARSFSVPGEDVVNEGDMKSNLEIARQLVIKVIKMIGEIRPDLILVAEEEIMPETLGGEVAIAACLEPLWNTIRYYDAEPLLVVKNIDGRSLELLAGDVSGIIFLGGAGCGLEELASLHMEKGVCFGLPVPGEVFAGQHELLECFLSDIRSYFGGRGIFACSAGEIPPGTPVEHLKKVVDALKLLA
jgi:hypothetical protein